MPGPAPKAASARARRNKVAGARALRAAPDPQVPELPEEAGAEWHPMTRSWWRDIWQSPMAPEFDTSDIHGLYALAMLVNAFWIEPSQGLAAEIRLQRQCYGLTPIDRRRLQWEIERGDAAEEATAARRKSPAPPKSVPLAGTKARKAADADPRSLLA